MQREQLLRTAAALAETFEPPPSPLASGPTFELRVFLIAKFPKEAFATEDMREQLRPYHGGWPCPDGACRNVELVGGNELPDGSFYTLVRQFDYPDEASSWLASLPPDSAFLTQSIEISLITQKELKQVS